MRTLLVIFMGILLIILESPFLGTLDARFYAPDFVLIVIVYLALTRPLLTGAISAFFLGFLKDGFTSGPFGMYMQISVTMYYVTKFVSMHVSLKGPISLIIYTLCASLLATLLLFGLSMLFDRSNDYTILFKVMIPQALMTAPFTPLIFYVLERLDLFWRPRTERIFFG